MIQQTSSLKIIWVSDIVPCALYVNIRIAIHNRQDQDLDIWTADYYRSVNVSIPLSRIVSHHTDIL